MRSSTLFFSSVLLVHPASAQAQSTIVEFSSSNCDVDQYYSSLHSNINTSSSEWTREDLSALLESTHSQVITPFVGATPGQGDVWEALTEVDAGAEQEEEDRTIHLLYLNIDVPAYPLSRDDNWAPEHLWRIFMGMDDFEFAFSDLHNLRAVHPSLHESNRYDLHFGMCDMEADDYAFLDCAPADACLCGDIFQPPADARGIVARTLLYMLVRYSHLQQQLSPCHLATLVSWQNRYPPTQAEISRNDQVCQQWQGNRNPFVDFPGLAFTLQLHADVSVARSDQQDCIVSYTSSQDETDNFFQDGLTGQLVEEIRNELDPCSTLLAGDVSFYLVQTWPDVRIGMLALTDLPSGLELFLTDNAWTGTSFQTTEGTVRIVLPDPIASGYAFGHGDNFYLGSSWTTIEPDFDISGAFGDEIFVYCKTPMNERIQVLSALSTNGSFQPAGWQFYLQHQSALPDYLQPGGYGVVILKDQLDYYIYSGPTFGPQNDYYQKALVNPQYWMGQQKRSLSPTSSPSEKFVEAETSPPSSASLVQLLCTGSLAILFSVCALL